VRATYLAIGMTDVYAETGDATLWDAVQGLWRSAFERKAYVTGGLGAHWAGEAFGADYELPSERAYAETCAAIGGFLWNWRMLRLTAEARYADWMEVALYNGILSGLSLDGTEYFYQNPLADEGTHRRQPWFGTACCPPNMARLLLALPGYLCTMSSEGLWIHHYAPGEIAISQDGAIGSVRVDTDYPWGGEVRVTVISTGDPEAEISLFLRVPGWAGGAEVMVNNSPAQGVAPGSYTRIRRSWKSGDQVTLHLPMEPRRVTGHPRVAATRGRVALARGPLVYCLEGVDQPGVDLRDVALRSDASLISGNAIGALDGAVSIGVQGTVVPAADEPLYRTYPGAGRGIEPGAASSYSGGDHSASAKAVQLTAVPYLAWANRAPGQMQVWIKKA
jgi:uncharacterized protein